MFVYNFNLAVVFIMFFFSRFNLDSNGYKINSKILNVIAFMSMWMVSGFRYFVGTDFEMYQNYYINIDNINLDNTYLEVGYLILNKAVKFLFGSIFNYQIIFIITSFIILYFIYKSILKYSLKYELSFYLFITMYFYYNSFNGLRQFIAIAITFFATRYIFTQDFRKYLLFIIVAYLFHKSALIMIPLYFFVNKKYSIKSYFIMSIMGLIAYIFMDEILNLIFILIPRYSKYSNGILSIFLKNGSHWIHYLIIFTIFVIGIIFKDKLVKINPKNEIFINFIFIATILQFLGMKSVLFSRMVYYVSIYSIVLIPNILIVIDRKLKAIYYMLVLVFFYLVNLTLLLLNQSNVLPYIYKGL